MGSQNFKRRLLRRHLTAQTDAIVSELNRHRMHKDYSSREQGGKRDCYQLN